jgi:UDP-glucose 4-epimerase
VSQLAWEPAAVGQVFNVGATEEITIEELAKRVIALTGGQSDIRFIPYDQAYAPGFEDMRRRVPSIDKISRLIGYKPSYTLDEMLESVIAHERNQLESGLNEVIGGLSHESASHSDGGNRQAREPY